MTTRTSGFRLLRIHGKVLTQDKKSEGELRNQIFHVGNLAILESRVATTNIRLLGYEVPLGKANRSYSIDLLGYDREHNPYLIELKRSTPKVPLTRVAEQLAQYAELFQGVRSDIEREIQKALFWDDFRFGPNIFRIILAGREFYSGRKSELRAIPRERVLCCSFARIRSHLDTGGNVIIAGQCSKAGLLHLKIENR